MKRFLAAAAGAAFVSVVFATAPPGVPPGAKTSPRVALLEYTAPVPATWQPQPPTSSFRLAQYRVPAAAQASEGEVIVYYFGQGQGGSAAANTERWTAQFSGADGQPVKPKVASFKVNGLPATLVELNGRYARGVGMGGNAPAKPDQTLLAAVVETPKGNLTFQLHGDRATVAQHRQAFEGMVKGLKAP